MSEASSRRIRRLIVANPDNSDEEQPTPSYPVPYQYPQHTPHFQTPSQPRPYESPPAPAPLKTTNLPTDRYQNPTPSPSNTSSPAQESPPQPSTPGLPAPPTDPLTFEHTTPTDHGISASYHERHDNPPKSTSRKLLHTLNPFNSHRYSSSQRSTSRRPATSPTVSTPDSYSSGSSISITASSSTYTGPGIAVAEKVIIIVTADGDRYLTVDISGAKDPAFIKERIFTRLSVQGDDQYDFTIYRTEIGNYNLGNPLPDDVLFALCREQGDDKGTLKFFVAHSAATVLPAPPSSFASMSPTFSPIPPAMVSAFSNTTHGPLRPRRRARSRHGSFSSASELLNEPAAGYEADFENPARDPHRSTLRPSLQQQATAASSSPASGNPPSPLSSSSWRPNGMNGVTPRAVSPQPHSSDPHRTPKAETSAPDKYGLSAPNTGPPPPVSPHRPHFSHDENSLLPPTNKHFHVRSGSDAAAEREQALQASEDQQNLTRQWRANQSKAQSQTVFKEPSRQRLRRQPSEYDDPIKRSDSWVMVEPSSSNVAEQTRSSPSLSRPMPSHVSPNRYNKPSPPYPRGLAIPNPPRQPPPPAPTNGDPRTPPPSRSTQRGVQVPSNWPVAYKAEEKSVDQRTMPSSSTQWTRFLKTAKSVDSLKAAAHAGLSPGRRSNQLPVSRSSRNDFSTSSGFSKSSDLRHPSRLPMQGGPSHSSSFDLSQTLTHHGSRTPLHSAGPTTSEIDPYPRPQSAFGDHPNSPSQKYGPRYMQSPTFTSSADHIDILRSPRALSPNRPMPPTSGYSSRPGTSDRTLDTQSAADTYRTPPHSPTSPRPSKHYSRLETTPVERTPKEEDVRATLMPDDQRWFAQQVGSGGHEGTLMPGVRRKDYADVPRSPLPSSSTSEAESTTLVDRVDDESDSEPDDNGTLMWQKKPVDGPKPQLRVQIESESGGVQPLSVPSTGTNSASSSVMMREQSSQSQSQSSDGASGSPMSTRPSSPNNGRVTRSSTFIDMREFTWAPRPSPEDVYERLEEFFPEHDLDKPVIDATSGGTSPTAADYPTPPPQLAPAPERGNMRSKKSIRIVAQEHKRKFVTDRTSRVGLDDTAHTSMARKRSTKLWGRKLEEVTTMQAAKASLGPPVPESPPGGPSKWFMGYIFI
ncbi:hypothetical protein HGRIS_008017 [Hohenbuehelia grisea]|uniref:Uncharacterized protein n=1 Tax=Hohenbuehelia grisea TaxID=104357 RepID=A0ABR3J823_9AGAR